MATGWLLLVTNLPGRNQALRMRVWRSLKAAGAGLLRDGVYLLPFTAGSQRALEGQAADIQAGGGSAQVLPLASAGSQQQAFEALFDRASEYAVLVRRAEAYQRFVRKAREAEARRQLMALKRDTASLIAIDFFARAGRKQMEQALASADAAFAARFAPNEPQAVAARIVSRQRREYVARKWGTRRRLWVDRVCSAWLIRRFIDPKSRFVWLNSPADLPRGAIGFDFDGAEFTHVGNRVTFEVLLASFDLEKDESLMRIGQLVHSLDVGGFPVPEAAGFAAILSGAQYEATDDDALVATVFPVLDLLYAGYVNSTSAV